MGIFKRGRVYWFHYVMDGEHIQESTRQGNQQVARDMEVIMYVYLTDGQDHLQGIVDLRELIAAEPEQALRDIMTDNLISLNPDDTLSDAVDMFSRYSFRAIPVTDAEDRLLGVVSYRDIRGIKPRLD